MSDNSLGTPAQLRDPNYTPPLGKAIPLGIQHVLAMFVSNVTPAIIVAGAAGFGYGSKSADFPTMLYLIQMSMLFAGVATLIQTIGVWKAGAKLPIVQGTSFAYLPIMIPAMAGAGAAGLGGLMLGVIVGGIFHFILGFFIKGLRFALPPLVTGLIVLLIGLLLVKVGIQYAAGGVPAIGKPEFGSFANWFVALIVIFVTLGVKFFSRGMMSVAAVLIGILAGYVVAYIMHQTGIASFAFGDWFARVGQAKGFEAPSFLRWGLEWNWSIIIGMCLMAFVSAIETVGDVSGVTKGGAGREATDEEIQGATFADGLGTAVAGVFGGLPNTSFSQNVGLVSMTGVMSRHVVTIGAIFLIIAGFIPKVGALVLTIPIEVLGGGVIVMFGMVAAAGVNMLSGVNWNRRNMIIFATSLSVGLGLYLVPEALQHLKAGGEFAKMMFVLLTSGLLPAAFIAIVLNLLLPEDEEDGGHETQLSGLGNTGGSGGTGDGTMSSAALVGAGAATAAAAATSAGSTASSATAPAAKLVSGSGSTGGSSTSGSGSGGSASSGGGASAAGSGASGGGASKTASAKAGSSKSSAAKSSASKSKSTKSSASKASATKKAPAKKAPAKKAAAKAPAKKAAAKKSSASSGGTKSLKSGKLIGSALDDLEFVDGIGPKTSKSLKNAGVGNLSGLIDMSDDALESAAQKAGTGGRPKSENWKKQARDILNGKPPQAKSDRAAWEKAKKKMG